MNINHKSDNPVLRHVGESVFAIAPYQPGRPIDEVAKERGINNVIKLASNENPLGPAPAAQQKINALSADALSRYPDGNCDVLRAALANRLQVRPQQIIFGNGSNEVLELAAQLMLTPNCAAAFSAHAFVVYELATASRRAKTIICPPSAPACPPALLPPIAMQRCENNYGYDLSALAKVANDTHNDSAVRLIYIANPNNPTGSWLQPERIEEFMQGIPNDVLVVLDEAYREYVDGSDALPTMFPNLLVTRTFSKIYGLAGLRIGFGVGEESLIQMLNRIRQPFNISAAAQSVAMAALESQEHVKESVRLNQSGMAQLVTGLDALGLTQMPSRANFVTFAAPSHMQAADVYEQLLNAGIIVRPLASYVLPNWLRVTIGREEENARFLDALAKIVSSTK